MTKKNSAAAFLANMEQEAVSPMPPVTPGKQPPGRAKPQAGSRDGLKHIGGYLAPDTVEKVAVLRARLKLDNSELMTLAIDELYSRQKAKKIFND